MGLWDQVADAHYSDNISTYLAKLLGYWSNLLLCVNLRNLSGFAQMDYHLLTGLCSAYLVESASLRKTPKGRGSCPGPSWRTWLHSLAAFLTSGSLQSWSSPVANTVILFPHTVYIAGNRATQKVVYSVAIEEKLCNL